MSKDKTVKDFVVDISGCHYVFYRSKTAVLKFEDTNLRGVQKWVF